MSHCWMWSKLKCFVIDVVNWVMPKNRGNSARFSIKCLSAEKGFDVKKKKSFFQHVS